MIEKEIDFFYGDNNSEVFQLVHPSNFTKTADYSEDLLAYVKGLKAKVDSTYALVNALSAGEFYGSNRNGDFFPEQSLREYHKTFEALGHVYKHHVNKDPKLSFGKVVFSHYNSDMHRVELILELDNSKAKDIVERLNGGELPAVSMGCRVPWDECSICHNRAANRSQYCEHLLTQMNKVMSSGQRVYAINTMPKFFDISVVLIPADKTAGFLAKVASYGENISEKFTKNLTITNKLTSLSKLAQMNTLAEIKKTVQANVESISEDPRDLIRSSQSKLSTEMIKKLAEYPLSDVLSTFLGLRVMPLKEDFQKIALYAEGKFKEADELEAQNITFTIDNDTTAQELPNVTLNNFNEKIAEILFDVLPGLTLTKEMVTTRVLTKLAMDGNENIFPTPRPSERSTISKFFFSSEEDPTLTAHKNPVVPLGILGGLYYGYAKLFNNHSSEGFRSFMLQNKWLLPILIGAGSAASIFAQDQTFNKNASSGVDRFIGNSLISVPVSYYFSAVSENKAKKGEAITQTENFVRKHPLLVGLAGSLGLSKAEKILDKSFGLSKISSLVARFDDETLDTIYNDLIN